MKLAFWKRTVLGTLVALSVAAGSLAPAVAGHAAADIICVRSPDGEHACWHVSN